jgi:hypothetical protein
MYRNQIMHGFIVKKDDKEGWGYLEEGRAGDSYSDKSKFYRLTGTLLGVQSTFFHSHTIIM